MQNLTDRLLSALDKEYNVTNMPVVVEIIGILEQTSITKEVLESTRLGRHVNELRRKTTDKAVAKRAKDLVRKWRDLIVPEAAGGANGIRTPLNKIQGQLSPGLPARKSQPASPASRVSSLSPDTRLGPSPAVSPRLGGASAVPALDNGTPAPRGRGRPPKAPSQEKSVPTHSPRPRGRPPKNKNKHKRDGSDLVPKTSPANKRLRKSSSESPPRVNGHSQVPRSQKVKTTRELLQSIQQESSLDALRNKTLSNLGVVKKPQGQAVVSTSPSLPKSMSVGRRGDLRSPPPSSPVPMPSRATTPPSPAGSDVDVERVSGSEVTPVKAPVLPKTVDEILAQLPPIRRDEIRWSEDEEDVDMEPEPCEVTEGDVLRLQDRHIEGLNGNTSAGAEGPPDPPDQGPHGLKLPLTDEHGTEPRKCPTDCMFREWHQTMSAVSHEANLIHILPYTIID